MQKKAIIAIVAACALIGIGTFYVFSSSPVPDKNKIKADLNNVISGSEIVDEVEITKRLTEKEKRKDTVWFKVRSHNDEASYIRYFVFEYRLYDEGGWERQSVAQDQTDLWSSLPLVGIKTDAVNNSLVGFNINIDDEQWDIRPDNIDSVTIDQQDTKLGQKKDSVTATINLKSDVLTAQGQMNLEYTYNNDGWVLGDYSLSKPFTSSRRPNTELEVTEGDLLAAVAKKSMIFGKDKMEQIISFSEKNILDFSLNSSTTQDKGTTQVFTCTFKVDKKIVVFGVDARITYKYDKVNDWNINEIRYSPKVLSVNIEGKWIGESDVNNGYAKTEDDISKVAPDGSFTAIGKTSPLPTNPSIPVSIVKMIGGIDFNNLKMVFVGKEWIVRPRGWNLASSEGILHVDSATIKGKGFEMKKEVIDAEKHK